MSESEQAIIELLELAERALLDEASEADRFLLSLGHYLDALERWRDTVDPSKADSPDPLFKASLSRLNETHQRLLERAALHREQLMTEMGSVQKKAKALRKYVDRFPERITITGKRKG